MDFKTFQKGIAILSACVSDFKATVDSKKIEVWYELTKDLSDRVYLDAVKRICRKTPNIYPGTNIVGLIHEAADQVRRERRKEPSRRLQLEAGYTAEQFEAGKQRLRELIKNIGGEG